jgi:hypothetical protein
VELNTNLVPLKLAILPDEAKALLVDVNDLEKATLERKWISFEGPAEAGCPSLWVLCFVYGW